MDTSEAGTSSASTSFGPIIVLSSDGKEFPMDLQMISQSDTLQKLVTSFEYDQPTTKREPIPANNVNSEMMAKVCEWMNHYKNVPPYVESVDKNHIPNLLLGTFQRNFFAIPNSELFELINAANYLNMPRLLDCSCKKVATMISGKTAEQLRATFNIKSDEQKKAEEKESDPSELESASSSDPPSPISDLSD
ncbi:unnamed protein product [Caenorhabditis sp. 36 PRJEB53466]|nr:unnamed protein product [Caenorhabditis sp. 36 PRJEB53466]